MAEQTTTNISIETAANADKDRQFLSNLDQLKKRIEKHKIAKAERERAHGIDEDGFPDDLNDKSFIEKGKLDGPAWGYDGAAPKE